MGKLFRIIIVSISLSCIYVSLINDYPYIYLLIAIFLIWINNILYGLEHFRRRIIFLGFNLTMFFFLLDRPLISLQVSTGLLTLLSSIMQMQMYY